MALYDPGQHHSLAFGGGLDPKGRDHGALVLWLHGYPDQALGSLGEVLTLSQEPSHPFGLSVALIFSAILHQLRREVALTQERANDAIALSTEHGFASNLAMGILLRGWTLAEQEQGMEGIAQIHEGLAAWRATGAEVLRPYFLALPAEAYRNVGQAEEGLSVLNEALVTAYNSGERWWEAELYRLKGQLILRDEPGRSSRLLEAGTCFLQALEIAQRQHAKSLELRAALSLSALWRRQGQGDAARGLLAEAYGWFTEGFDTADLKAAKALLHELSSGSGPAEHRPH